MKRVLDTRRRFLAAALFVVCLLTRSVDATAFNANTKGSVFFLPNIELRWDSAGNLTQDTFIHLRNGFPEDVDVYMVFVNGDAPLPANGSERAHPGWNRIDAQITLTVDQPTYWSSLTGMGAPGPAVPPFQALDPGNPPGRPDPEGTTDRVVRGFMVGWAVNSDGVEIRWNHLSSTATVLDFRTGGAWGYNAYHAQAVNPAVLNGDPTGTPGILNLDNVEFAAPPAVLMFNFPADGSGAYSGPTTLVTSRNDLTLQPVSADFRQASNGPLATNADFTVWNMNEVKFTGMKRCVSCWDQRLTQIYAAPPNYFSETFLQTRVGWAEVDGRSDANCASVGGGASIDAPMIGVLSRKSVFQSLLEADYAGFNLFGRGRESAQIHYDLPNPQRSMSSESAAPKVSTVSAVAASSVADADTARASDGERGFADDDRFSTNQPGNLVYVSKIDVRWDLQGNLTQDTFVHLTNWFDGPVKVQMYFVNGDPPLPVVGGERAHPGWNALNAQIDLTSNQPVYWSAARGDSVLGVPPWTDLDPGSPPGRPDPEFGGRMLRGFVVAWAVDEDCREIAGNLLMADAILINYHSQFTSSWGYNAYHLPNIGNVPFGEPSGTPGTLLLNSADDYPAAFDQLTFISPADGSTAYSVQQYVTQNALDITLHHVTADFTPNSTGPLTSKAQYLVWNQQEILFAGMYKCVTCWDESFIAFYDGFVPWEVATLQTNVGASQIDGIASASCDSGDVMSANAPMLGVIANFLFIDAGGQVNQAWVGHNMFGQGTEEARIDSELCESCPWDIATNAGPGSDGVVNLFDLLLLLDNWNTANAGADIAPPVNIVNLFDLLDMIDHWGPCP